MTESPGAPLFLRNEKRETRSHARPTLDAEQRAPVYTLLGRHLTSIDDIRILSDDDPDEAGRLALHYADDLRPFEDIGRDRDDPRDSIG